MWIQTPLLRVADTAPSADPHMAGTQKEEAGSCLSLGPGTDPWGLHLQDLSA